jgi:phosphate acetyltransferase
MKFIESVFQKLRRHPKRIVFPEGTEPRILQAAEQFVKLQLGPAIVLGNRGEVEKIALCEKVNLDHIHIIDPETSSDLPVFCERMEKLKRYHNLGPSETRAMMIKPNYFAAMMVQYGQADGLVGGTSTTAGTLLRPLIQLIKPLPNVKTISSCMILEFEDKSFGENGVMLLADCAVVPEPNVHQLATIAVETGKIARQLSGIAPRIALLSFSTKGSAKHPATEKVAAAAALAKQRATDEGLDMMVGGELQADTAILPNLAAIKAPESSVAGRANVLVFPDLNSGNIAAKLVQHLAKPEAYGQILLGLSSPCADMSRGASVHEIVGVAAIIGLQAIAYRKLYPEQHE